LDFLSQFPAVEASAVNQTQTPEQCALLEIDRLLVAAGWIIQDLANADLYNRPTKAPLKFEDLKALADTLQAPPHLWTESQLWQAYAALDQSKVKGASRRRILTDLVSLVRYAMHQENELVPYPERVAANFKAWMAQQQTIRENSGKAFTDEQRWWLERMAEHIASNLGIEAEDFGYAPFDQRGGLGRVDQLFGAELPRVIDDLTRELAA